MAEHQEDTIAAIATATGHGGVGIVRVSGTKVLEIAERLLGFSPKPRYAHYCPFLDSQQNRLDEGIALYFPGPNSFTGEDVLEFQGHGGPVVLDLILRACLQQGARLAEPGEFSKRAFLNDKLDLVQAEAISDLINSSSEQAARCALRSLQGEFSRLIEAKVSALIKIRMFVEAAIDFPEEEIDFLADSDVLQQLQELIKDLENLLANANQGALITEGIRVVIAGKPNAGKSSLLNALAGKEAAIVTDIAGTTRDVVREQISIDGMPLHIIDTAGLRESEDRVEQIGIERAWQEINQADHILLVFDAQESLEKNLSQEWQGFLGRLDRTDHVSLVRNKIDLTSFESGLEVDTPYPMISLSAKQHLGIQFLREHLKQSVGYSNNAEGLFTARRRHLHALEAALDALITGKEQLEVNNAGELLAEDLRMAQEALSSITGAFSADDLLGEIFSSFCIGK